MISLGIPSWFREENEDKNICKSPFDYELIGSEIDALEQGLIDGWKETDIQQFLKKDHIYSMVFILMGMVPMYFTNRVLAENT